MLPSLADVFAEGDDGVTVPLCGGAAGAAAAAAAAARPAAAGPLPPRIGLRMELTGTATGAAGTADAVTPDSRRRALLPPEGDWPRDDAAGRSGRSSLAPRGDAALALATTVACRGAAPCTSPGGAAATCRGALSTAALQGLPSTSCWCCNTWCCCNGSEGFSCCCCRGT